MLDLSVSLEPLPRTQPKEVPLSIMHPQPMSQALTRPTLQARPQRNRRPHKPNSPPKPGIPEPTLLAKLNHMILDEDEQRLIHENPHSIIILQTRMTQHRRSGMYTTANCKPHKELHVLTRETPPLQAQEIPRDPDSRRRAKPTHLLMPHATPTSPDTVAPPQIIEHAGTLARPCQKRSHRDERVQRSHQLEGDVRQGDVHPRPVQSINKRVSREREDRGLRVKIEPGAVRRSRCM